MQRYTVIKTLRITFTQAESLRTLENYGVDVSHFIRDAIKEKLRKEWKQIKEKKETIIYPF